MAVNEFNSLRQYLIEIGQYPLLTASEELELAYAYRHGDIEAREKLINSNLRLVVSIAKAYKNQHLSIQELISEGNIGLITAVEKYNPDLGYRFSTCATPWIKQSISKSITDKGKTVRIPAHIFQMLSQYRKVVNELLATEGGEYAITDEKIATKMGIDVEKVRLLREVKHDAVSLDTPLGDDTDDTIADLQADDSKNPAELAAEHILHEKLVEIIKGLDERTKTIFMMRYGLGDENDPEEFRTEHTLEAVGDYLGITRERVRQIEKQTLSQLKTKYEGKL